MPWTMRSAACRCCPAAPGGASEKRPLVPRDRDASGNPIPGTGGLAKASTDPDQIGEWWERWPNALIGAAMGQVAGVFAIDPDAPKHADAPDGLAAWADLLERHGGIPHTHTHETPNGGRHVLFTYPEGRSVTNREGALKGLGINVRGEGGYIIMPPSRLSDGRAYKLAEHFDFWRFAAAPPWLLDLITAGQGGKAESGPEARADSSKQIVQQVEGPVGSDDADLSRYVAAAVVKECDLVAGCEPGHRNNQLNEAAFKLGTLVGAQVLDKSVAARRLRNAAETCGLLESDGELRIADTIERGLAAGQAEPRDLSAVRARTRPQQDPGVAPRTLAPLGLPAGDGLGAASSLVTEDGAAQLFARRYDGHLRYCHDHGSWFEWTGAIWRRDGRSRAFHYARELARLFSRGHEPRTEAAARKAAFAGAVERFARADPVFAVTSEAWDPNPFLLGTPGGTVDLRTGALRPARHGDGITRSTTVTPADTAECPLWLRFLDEATDCDAEMIRFLQLWAGYSLTGDTREHALVFVYGPGGNGKSVAVNVQTGIMGDYAVTASMDAFIASQRDRHPTDLAMLRGARLVTASETEEGRQWNESRIKQLTGGDNITARFMLQDFFTFRPNFKLMIIGNHKPGLRSVDEAMRRRFALVPFVHTPSAPDRQLEEKLRSEWPGILRWAIEGTLAWRREGLIQPATVREATAAYFNDQDTFSAWLEEECDVEVGNEWKSGTSAALFAAWSRYAQSGWGSRHDPQGLRRAHAASRIRNPSRRKRSAQLPRHTAHAHRYDRSIRRGAEGTLDALAHAPSKSRVRPALR